MVLADCKKKKRRSTTEMMPPRVTLASIESLSIPLMQEVVFLADYRCTNCQQRVAQLMSKMNGETESITINVVEKKVSVTFKYSEEAGGTAGCGRNPFNIFARFFFLLAHYY